MSVCTLLLMRQQLSWFVVTAVYFVFQLYWHFGPHRTLCHRLDLTFQLRIDFFDQDDGESPICRLPSASTARLYGCQGMSATQKHYGTLKMFFHSSPVSNASRWAGAQVTCSNGSFMVCQLVLCRWQWCACVVKRVISDGNFVHFTSSRLQHIYYRISQLLIVIDWLLVTNLETLEYRRLHADLAMC